MLLEDDVAFGGTLAGAVVGAGWGLTTCILGLTATRRMSGTHMQMFSSSCGKCDVYNMSNVYDGNRLKRLHTETSKYYKYVGTSAPMLSGEYIHISEAGTYHNTI